MTIFIKYQSYCKWWGFVRGTIFAGGVLSAVMEKVGFCPGGVLSGWGFVRIPTIYLMGSGVKYTMAGFHEFQYIYKCG